MNSTTYGFLLTTFAGFSTLIGTVLIFIKTKHHEKIIVGALSFAAGVMTTVSLTDLIPESITALHSYFYIFPTVVISMIFLVIGIIISMLIDKYLPDQQQSGVGNSKLYRVGLISMLAIIFHNIPEGIATFMAGTSNATLGLSLAIAIALHNIPEGISISIPIYYATGKRGKALLYTVVSALSEPFGALIAFLFLSKFINNMILGMLFSMIAGIMIHISFYELLPTAKKYHQSKVMIVSFIFGIVFMVINHFLF